MHPEPSESMELNIVSKLSGKVTFLSSQPFLRKIKRTEIFFRTFSPLYKKYFEQKIFFTSFPPA